MEVHFINVGHGNMVLICIPKSKTIIYDCNVTEENKDYVLDYIENQISNNRIDIFINSHRDADHLRGIKILYDYFGIDEIWDSGVPGTTTDTHEYLQYMKLRREIGKEVKAFTFEEFGDCILRIMNSKNENFTNSNDQSLVVKIEYGDSSAMLTGDTSYKTWKEFILRKYSEKKLKTNILLASHHGSLTFFDDPSDKKNYYISHIKKMTPEMTLISVGNNPHGLPESKAIELYKKYSRGSNKGNKVYRTDKQGTMVLNLKDEGGWNLSKNR